jgi:hypothetical protein
MSDRVMAEEYFSREAGSLGLYMDNFPKINTAKI